MQLQSLELYSNIPADQWTEFTQQANQLDVANNQRFACLDALGQIPRNERPAFVQAMNNCQATQEKRHHFAPILSSVAALERDDFVELANGMSLEFDQFDDKIEAIRALGGLSSQNKRQAVLDRAMQLVSQDMSGARKATVICSLCRIGSADLNDSTVQTVCSRRTKDKNWEMALDELSRSPEEGRQEIYAKASKLHTLLKGTNNGARMAKLIEIVKNSPEIQLDALMCSSKAAIHFWMDNTERMQIIEAMAQCAPKNHSRAYESLSFFMPMEKRLVQIRSAAALTTTDDDSNDPFAYESKENEEDENPFAETNKKPSAVDEDENPFAESNKNPSAVDEDEDPFAVDDSLDQQAKRYDLL